jgi:dTDP-4-amino-4,6-dideoxygalactose transaminase
MAIPRISLPLSYADLVGILLRLPIGRHRDGATVVHLFEQAFAEHYRRGGAVTFCKARMAFYHLLQALDLPAGAEVIMSPLHVADFVNIIRLAGFRPVLVDLEADSFCIDLADLRRKAGPTTGAILITHLSGHAHDMEAVAAIASEVDAVLLEDCSQAFGASFRGRVLGSFGQATIYSLSLLKSVCTLNGGVVLSDDATLLSRLRTLQAEQTPPLLLPLAVEAIKNLVIKIALSRTLFSVLVLPLLRLTAASGDRFSHYQKTNKTVELRQSLPPAFLTAFSWQQAWLGLRQLQSLDRREATRIAAARLLREHIADSKVVRRPVLKEGSDNSWWLFPLLVRKPGKMKAALARRGVDSAPMLLSFIPGEDAFAELGLDACPNAQRLHAETLFVPVYHDIDDEDVRTVWETIAEGQREISNDGLGCEH